MSKVFSTSGIGVPQLPVPPTWKILPSRLPHQTFIPRLNNNFHVIT